MCMFEMFAEFCLALFKFQLNFPAAETFTKLYNLLLKVEIYLGIEPSDPLGLIQRGNSYPAVGHKT